MPTIRKQKILELPLPLKRALIAAAEDEGTNMNDVAVAILAAKFKHSFTPSGKGTPGLTDATRTGLLMPSGLRRKINVEAARREESASSLIVNALEEHFGLSEAA